MGTYTSADEALVNAKYHLGKALDYLLVFINPSTYGHEDYKAEYIAKVTKFTLKLRKIL